MRSQILWVMLLLATANAALSQDFKKHVFFGNGVFTDERTARGAAQDLDSVLRESSEALGLSSLDEYVATPDGWYVELAYNSTLCSESGLPGRISCLGDLIQSLFQLGLLNENGQHLTLSDYWELFLDPTGIGGLEAELLASAALEIVNAIDMEDRHAHASRYAEVIASGNRVILVSHSQGNLFALRALEEIEEFLRPFWSSVSVATPASTTPKSGPYTTLMGDFIHHTPGALGPNIGQNCGWPWACHSFVNSYLTASSASKQQIVEQIFAPFAAIVGLSERGGNQWRVLWVDDDPDDNALLALTLHEVAGCSDLGVPVLVEFENDDQDYADLELDSLSDGEYFVSVSATDGGDQTPPTWQCSDLPISVSHSTIPALVAPPVLTSACALSRPALGPDGRLFLAVGDTCDISTSTIAGPSALNVAAGTLDWGPVVPAVCDERPFGGKARMGHRGVSIAANGTIFAVGDNNECNAGLFFALSLASGSATQVSGCPNSPHPRVVPPIDDTRSLAYYGSEYLCSVDVDDLSRQTIGSGGYQIGGTGMLLDELGNRFLSTYNSNSSSGVKGGGRVKAYKADGTADWTHGFSAPMRSPQLLAVSGDRLYLSHLEDDDTLSAWQTADGQDVPGWIAQPDTSRMVINANGDLFASRVSTPIVVGLNSDGSVQWSKDLGDEGATWADLDFVDADGILYVRGNEMLFALDGDNEGALLWSEPYETVGEIHIPAALDADGHIVLFDETSYMYVLDTDLAYADSDWPIALHGTPRHTGAAPPLL